jgi:4-hydroxy-4-methyl-2-oxoglutarate aldolase
MDFAQRFARLYAGVVYDAMRFDVRHAEPFVVDAHIKSVWRLPRGQSLCGPAFTCKGQRVLDVKHVDDTVRIKMFRHFVSGCVQVIDTGGDTSVAHFGDISGKLARKFGAVGAVIDGMTRDARILESDGFPVFCRGAQPIDAFGRWQITAYQEPIVLAGIEGPVSVAPGDYIFADHDGVLVIPKGLTSDVLGLAEARYERENNVRRELSATEDVQGLYDRIGRW